MKWNEFFLHALIDYKRFGPINAIFTVAVKPKIRQNSEQSDFASHAIRFLFVEKTATTKDSKRFLHRPSTRNREIGCAFHAMGRREEFATISLMRMGVSPFLFWIYSVPLPPYSRFHPNSPLFPRFLSLSLSRQSINRRNGLIDFISRSRCPQFQFSRACVFRLVEIHRRAYVVDRF